MSAVVVGIDPGKTGAIAVVNGLDGRLLGLYDMPVVDNKVSEDLLADLIEQVTTAYFLDDVLAVVEHVSSMPKQGVASSFNFGESFGIIKGVLAGAAIPREYVRPHKWKAAMGLRGSDKDKSRRKAIDRWPSWSGSFKRKKDDGRAEAALLAAYHVEANRPDPPPSADEIDPLGHIDPYGDT